MKTPFGPGGVDPVLIDGESQSRPEVPALRIKGVKPAGFARGRIESRRRGLLSFDRADHHGKAAEIDGLACVRARRQGEPNQQRQCKGEQGVRLDLQLGSLRAPFTDQAAPLTEARLTQGADQTNHAPCPAARAG